MFSEIIFPINICSLCSSLAFKFSGFFYQAQSVLPSFIYVSYGEKVLNVVLNSANDSITQPLPDYCDLVKENMYEQGGAKFARRRVHQIMSFQLNVTV